MRRAEEDGYRMSSFVRGVVASEAFQMAQAEDDGPEAVGSSQRGH